MHRSQLVLVITGIMKSASRGTKRAMDAFRRVISDADVWIQDHYWVVVISVLLALGSGTALLLQWRWAEVTDFARQIAPVLTIVSIIASALLSVLAWFRRRRHKRLATQAAANSHGGSGG